MARRQDFVSPNFFHTANIEIYEKANAIQPLLDIIFGTAIAQFN
jgi:hypothetical protein